MKYTTISIIIQARSTSTRFPGKIFEKIGGKEILAHVLDACNNSAQYINAYSARHGNVCGVAICTPENDALIPRYSKHKIIEGSESDVLSRYKRAAEILQSDYVVRITSDCPFVPPFIISKLILIATKDGLDFLTNASPRYRTSPDGHDVEVISRRTLDWLDENATGDEREHVTSRMHISPPPWAKIADVIGFADMSSVKLSVDTPEDLKRIEKMHLKIYESVRNSPKSYRL